MTRTGHRGEYDGAWNEQQRRSEERFRTIYEHAPVMIDSFDSRGRCVLWNRECERNLGYTKGEIEACDDPLAVFYPDPDVRDRVLKTILRADGKFREYEPLTKDGGPRTQMWADFRLPGGDLISVGYDITEQRRAIRAVQDSEAQLRQVIDLVPHMIFAKDREGRFLLVNEAVARAYGTTVDKLMVARHADIHEERAELEHFLKDDLQVIESGEPKFIPEETFVDVFGNERILQTTKIPFTAPGTEERAVLGVAVDVTERKRAEEGLIASEAQLRALASRLQSVREEESASIAREIHDELAQTLTGLKMDISWVKRRIVELDDDLPSSEIMERLESMSKEVDETVQAVRRISTKLRPVILDDLGLMRALEWQAREFEKRTDIACDFNVRTERYNLDPGRSTAVFRIFQEILTNVARHAVARHVTVDLRDEDGLFLLDVADDGRGITTKEMTSPRSLGLLGMRERAQVFGGGVDIRRRSARGTRVIVRVPME